MRSPKGAGIGISADFALISPMLLFYCGMSQIKLQGHYKWLRLESK
jgi:hypothetical protein